MHRFSYFTTNAITSTKPLAFLCWIVHLQFRLPSLTKGHLHYQGQVSWWIQCIITNTAGNINQRRRPTYRARCFQFMEKKNFLLLLRFPECLPQIISAQFITKKEKDREKNKKGSFM